MSDRTSYHDISIAPRRYMQRQWKRNKPHLSPSDSLPALRLCPNRPLFVCARCGFANAWIPLCLWCEWTSTEATKQFEASLPRPRRLSAPSRAVPPPKKARRHTRGGASTDSTLSSTGPHTPRSERPFAFATVRSAKSASPPTITTALEPLHSDMCHDDHRLDPHNVTAVKCDAVPLSVLTTNSHNVQKGTLDGGGVHRVATVTSITPPLPISSPPNFKGVPRKHNSEDLILKRNPPPHRRKLPPLRVCPQPARFRASAPTAERARQDTIVTQAMASASSVLTAASRTPRSTGSMDVSNDTGLYSTPSISSSQCSPTRGLRRAQNMAFLNRDSSLSPRSRSPLRNSVDMAPTSVVDARQSHVPSLTTSSHDHDLPPVRLGHPSRPYYSAIRKDMSRPTSPVFSIATPRTPSPIPSHVDYAPRGTRSLDCGDRCGTQYAQELRPMSAILSSAVTAPTAGCGFSVSGEMELRMNLARWRQENALDEPGDYHFRETRRSRSKVNMKGRMKQLGKGLKEFVLRRS